MEIYWQGKDVTDFVQVRKCVVRDTCGGRCAVFAGADGAWKYAVGQVDGDLRALVKQLNAALNGRGGGKPFFAQGSAAATKREIEAFFAEH